MEPRRTRISEGIFGASKIQALAPSHPQLQLDVLFPSSLDILEASKSLLKFETKYWRGKTTLTHLYCARILKFKRFSSILTALSLPQSDSDDVWCLDPRGVLTLQVCKDTYETLGLVGTKLPFKLRRSPEQYVIRIPLNGLDGKGVRVKTALEAWDARRNTGGRDVLYSTSKPGFTAIESHAVHTASPQIRTFSNIHVPTPSLSATLRQSDDPNAWKEDISSLFEWIGMACLGAQRLKANDSVDPYVAVFEPPSGSRVGSVTHIQWKGFLSVEFAQSVLDLAKSAISKLTTPDQFISITSHAFPTSPVSYLPQAPNKEPPLRVVRADAEDTWSLILAPDPSCGQPESSDNNWRWLLAESIGQWDMRWG
ncbi:hypothetical protein JAAARDRAFT_704816 [Jaapia argillacea MUCL 33604]|uniref:Uncharacterized protein n=1 Tax=Jaapia argillacea MUCL 33604 TaxID=933084 RepID=A0A067Q3G2_9AGAM|nr:hypothetical protein JAAARDRAFT_704816 [Jaapia argillacea MUCL 33604]